MAETGGGLPPIENPEEDRIRTSHSRNRSKRFGSRIANCIKVPGCLVLGLASLAAAGVIYSGIWSYSRSVSEKEDSHRTTPLQVTSELENIVAPEYKLKEVILEKEPYRVFALAEDETVRPYGKEDLLNT